MSCHCWTLTASTDVCGTSEPGTVARESRNSRISATRIEVSWRQNQRAQLAPSRTVQVSHPRAPGLRMPPKEPGIAWARSSAGAVDIRAPAAPASVSSGAAAEVLSVLAIAQIPGVKLRCVHVCRSTTMLSHTPVTRSTPTTTSIAPPARMTHA